MHSMSPNGRKPEAAPRLRPLATGAALAVLLALSATDAQALVVNEIMYHSEEVDDRPFEWIELFNENLDPLDLGGYQICNGTVFEFPSGTWLEGFSFVVVASDPASFRAKYDLPDVTVIGGWGGALDNGGERLEICNPGGVTVAEVDYNDRGKWPVAADGTGHSLSLVDPYTDIDDADNWVASIERDGTPGEWNGHTSLQTGGPAPQEGMNASGFILDWLILGPYEGSGCGIGLSPLRADWLRGTTSPVQTDLEWRDGQVVDTDYSRARSTGLHPNADAGTPTVELYRSFSDTINLNDGVYPPDPDQVMAYSFVYVDNVTGEDLSTTFAAASDDAIDVLVNGQREWTNDVCRAVGGSGTIQDRFDVVLQPGKNLIAVKVFEQGGGWSFRLRIEEQGTGAAIVSPGVIQVTTDVDAGLGFDGSGTPIIDPDDVGGGDPGGSDDLPGRSPVVINEGHLRTDGERWIELYNRSDRSVDLAGYWLTDDKADLQKTMIADGVVVPAGGFVSFTETELGLDLELRPDRDRVFVALVEPDAEAVADAFNFEPEFFGFSEARIPDGDREFDDGADPTREAPNTVSANDDIVINEIMYHPIDQSREGEYLELYNRGDAAVDLTGWALTNGVDFAFADGTAIPSGGFLVVARNPQRIRTRHGLSDAEVVGPSQEPEALDDFGALRDSGERVTLKDDMERTVDTVRYHDGTKWARWADGHGSSLELIDPLQDNRFGLAWDASDDSGEAPVQEFSYLGRHGGGESELHLFLNSRGIAVVDDLSVVGGGFTTDDRPIVERGSEWRYLKGTSAPPAGWNTPGFDDSAWSSGTAGIGYGDGDDVTVLDDMQGNYVTVFLRQRFQVDDPAVIDELVLNVLIDDGFIAWLNGVEVSQHNISGRDYDDPAGRAVGDFEEVERDLTDRKDLLQAGTNVIAFQVHNVSLTSSDLSFNASLLDRTTTATGGTELLGNGTFDSSVSGWRIEGNHVRSGRTRDDPIAGAGSLKLVATGRGDNQVNRLETTDGGIQTLPTAEDVLISFQARWVVGSQALITHGYRHTMAKSHRLEVPETLGSPGRPNSVTLRQDAQNGGNLGPVMGDLVQDPPVPGEGEDVTVRVRVSDPDGVSQVRLLWSTERPRTSPASVDMSPAGDGWYEGTIPGQSLRTKVVFHIEAEDDLGAVGRFPADVSQRTHPFALDPDSPSLADRKFLVYRHDVADPATPYQNYRFWMSSLHENILATRQLHSNDALPGSFVRGSSQIFHQAEARFSGSPWARGGFGGSWRVKLPRDETLQGTMREFNMENHGADARERISHYLIRQTNVGGVKVPYSEDQVMVRWQMNDRTTAVRERVMAPNAQFLNLWWEDDDDGDFFEMDDRFLFNDGGSRDSSTDARLLYPPPSPGSDGDGQNKENYRFFFGLRAETGQDDYSELIDFAQVMDPGATRSADFDREIWDMANVEEFLRIWAVRLNTDDWDTWGARRGKNAYLYRPDREDRWYLLAWDMELTYGDVNSFLIPSSPTQGFQPSDVFPEVNRMLNRPRIKRMYYAILDEMVNGADRWFDSSFLTPYMDRLADIGMGRTGVGRQGGYIDQRASRLRNRIGSILSPQVRFGITTNGGSDFEVDATTTSLAGTAPAEVDRILVVRNGDDGTLYPITYTDLTHWQLDGIELEPGANDLRLLGLSLAGRVAADDSITVTSTVVTGPPPELSAIDPATAPPGEMVELSGTGFAEGVRVFFGGVEAGTVERLSDTRVRVEVPPGSGDVDVTARNPGSELSGPVAFSYPPSFVRGDANDDGLVDLSDAVRVLLHLFAGASLSCEEAADVDDDGALAITDAVWALDFLFRGGEAPPAPFPEPGPDLDDDPLGCGV